MRGEFCLQTGERFVSPASPPPSLAVRSTIRRKIIGVVLVGIVTTILLVTAANSWRETMRYSAAKTAEITATANIFASAVADPVAARDRIAILKTLRAIGKIPSFSHARVEDLSGNVLAELGSAVSLEEHAELPIFLRSSLDVGVDVMKGGEQIGRLKVLVKTDDLRHSLIEGLLTGLAAAILSGAIGVIIAFRLQRRITDPLRKLTQTMFEVEQSQNFEQSVDHASDDETGVLVATFNKMLVQIRALEMTAWPGTAKSLSKQLMSARTTSGSQRTLLKTLMPQSPISSPP